MRTRSIKNKITHSILQKKLWKESQENVDSGFPRPPAIGGRGSTWLEELVPRVSLNSI